MAESIVKGLVEGGKASAGPPLGPALGPMGVNVTNVVDEINKATAQFSGIKIPVKIIVDTSTKEFKIEVGMPPTSALILKELNLQKGAKEKGEIVGNLTISQAKNIAEAKSDRLFGSDIKNKVKQIIGTCKSMGITCENIDPRQAIQKIDSGEIKV